MFLPHVIEVADEFMFEAMQKSIRCSGTEVNPVPQKVKSFSVRRELLAFSFDPRPCGEITMRDEKLGFAQILPDIAAITPAPAAIRPNHDRGHSDQTATISKCWETGFESLTTRLRPRGKAGHQR
jgi:hypothetical protein